MKGEIEQHVLLSDRMNSNEDIRELQNKMFHIRKLILKGDTSNAFTKIIELAPSVDKNIDLLFKIKFQIVCSYL
jgi:hypothetical protein